jgi:dihydrolipoamide dehydrogenase
MDRIIPMIDHEASDLLTQTLRKKGMEIITSARITEIVDKDNRL